MTGYILLGVFLLLVLLLAARIKLAGEYSEEGFSVKLKYLPLRFLLYPPKPKKEKKKKAKPKQAKTERKKKEKKERPKRSLAGDYELFKKLLPDVLDLLKQMGRYFRCDRITIDFVAGSEDACATAMQFGGAYTAGLFIYDTIAPALKCKKRNITVNADFLATSPKVYVLAEISVAPWQLFAIGFKALKIFLSNRKAILGSPDKTSN